MSSSTSAHRREAPRNPETAIEKIVRYKKEIYYGVFSSLALTFLIVTAGLVEDPTGYLVDTLVVALLLIGLCFYWLIYQDTEEEGTELSSIISR